MAGVEGKNLLPASVATLPGEPNSYILCFATHPSDPNLVLASSIFGQLFYSEDGGGSWQKVRQEFTEVRSLAWMPS